MRKFEVGNEVVVSDSPDSPLFFITEIKGLSVRLGYTTTAGMRVDSGWFDVAMLLEPTQEQRDNYNG